MSEVCIFADDNTLYSCYKYLQHVFSNFKYDLRNALGVTTDNELIKDLCKKASYKLHVLRRIRGYLTVEKTRI